MEKLLFLLLRLLVDFEQKSEFIIQLYSGVLIIIHFRPRSEEHIRDKNKRIQSQIREDRTRDERALYYKDVYARRKAKKRFSLEQLPPNLNYLIQQSNFMGV